MLCLRWFWCVGIGDNHQRIILQYCLLTQSNINKLESVQRRAARFATGNYNTTSSVTTILNHLNWDTLQHRRLRTKAIMMYRIINGLVAIEPPPCMHHLGVVTRGQQQKYIVPYSRTTVHNPVMEPTTRGHNSSLGPGILQKGNPGSQILTSLTLFLIVHSLSLAQAWLF
jgi:hypothetical protein